MTPPDSELSQFFERRPKTRFLPKLKVDHRKTPAFELYQNEDYKRFGKSIKQFQNMSLFLVSMGCVLSFFNVCHSLVSVMICYTLPTIPPIAMFY